MSFFAKANPVDLRIAQNIGAKFMTANTNVQLRGIDDLQHVKTYCINRGNAAFYVFNTSNGFVIVSADDCAIPILGYSVEGQFDENNIPIQMEEYLQGFVEQIQYGIENNIVADEKTAGQWRMVKATGKLSNNRDNEQVGPLLTTTWDQGCYYNAMCPEDPNGYCDGRVPTGCVATAMAQIMNYWEYPTHGRGSHSYNVSNLDPGSMYPGANTTGYGTLYVDFENATYDYNNMPDMLNDESTQEEIDAVAQLMYHCGVAVNMMYGADESGAYEDDVRSALISYFGYIQSLGYAQRQMYSDSEWADSLRANINRGEPVFYCGRSIFGAHAFVLDGYNQDDYYHFNFGWSGYGDGWYQTSAINPSYSFNHWQSAIMGIRPNSDSHSIICQRKMLVQNVDNFIVSEPVHLYPMRAGSEYRAVNEICGVRIDLNLVPENDSGQLVLDVLDFGMEQSVVIYDGVNKDSLVRVIETRNLDDYTTVTYHTWLYEGLPEDSVFQNMAGTDFSPIVSTHHGFTVVVYSNGGQPESFHLCVHSDTDTIDPGTPTNDKIYWTDVVKSEPDGYFLDDDTIRITSTEGLAWVSHCLDSLRSVGSDWEVYQYYHRIISIENDLDMAGYYWKPILVWFGDIYGHGHVISNMDVDVSGSGGLFMSLINNEISDLGLVNAKINAIQYAGTIASDISNCHVTNCFSENHIINSGNGFPGGLFGSAYDSQITNCYAYGNLYSYLGWGGLVGNTRNTQVVNCVTSQGNSFNWCSMIPEYNLYRGLLTNQTQGGGFYNCFADISNSKYYWNNDDPEAALLAKRTYFLGNVYNVGAIENLAAFNASVDPTGTLLADTAVNYTLGDDMDVVTALNNKVAAYNSPDIRTWLMDSETHLPVFGGYYEVTCPNVSEITAENIPYNGSFAVALSWQENGDAEEWQVKYNIRYAPEEDAVVFTTNTTQNTLEGLSLGNEYSFYVRPICGEETIGWGEPLNFVVDKMLWIDAVTSCPDGYSEDSNGNVTISSPEGLAWLAKIGFDYRQDTIFIVSDLDMGAYKWTTIGHYDFRATIEGNNHTISNLYCKEDIRDNNARYIGLVGQVRNASLKNIIIENSSFEGYAYVGGLFGEAYESTVVNCHAVNVVAKGIWVVGGLGGIVSSDGGVCITYNCSATGEIYGDQTAGGLLGGHSYAGVMTNCYSNCDVQPFGYGNIFEYRGGLCGSACGNIYNCYSAGTVLGHEQDRENSVGSFMGYFDYGELKNVYALQTEDYSFIGKAEYDYVISDTASFSNSCALNNSITISGTSYTDLLSALNAWVDDNNSENQYLHWVADTENVNGGFPVLERLEPNVATVNVVVTPAEGGTIIGAGSYDVGAKVTLKAIPNDGYAFVNWIKDGTVISTNSVYSFTMIEDIDLEAVFEISVSIQIGDGDMTNDCLPSFSYYNYSLTQQIYTHEEIGNSKTINSISYFNAGDTKTRTYDIYMVHTEKNSFNGSNDWIPVAESNRVFSGSVTMTNDCWTKITLDVPFTYNGTSNIAVIVDDNTGAWSNSPHMNCKVFNANNNQAIRVYSDDTNYDPYNPSGYSGAILNVKNQIVIGIPVFDVTATANPEESAIITGAGPYCSGATATLTATANNGYAFINWTKDGVEVSTEPTYSFTVTESSSFVANFGQTGITQTITLSTGWNWCSTYIELDGVDGLAMLENALADNCERIMSQTAFTNYYDGYGWYGSLDNMVNEQMYRLHMTAPATITLTGNAADPANHPITMSKGWNHIGFVSANPIALKDAFANLEKTDQDMVKIQSGFAIYYEQYDIWYGSMFETTSIMPGQGLMYKSNNDSSVTFTYPESSPTDNIAMTPKIPGTHWTFDNHTQYDAIVTGELFINGESMKNAVGAEYLEIGAFCGDECRGSYLPDDVQLPFYQGYAYQMQIYSNVAAGEEITFRIYDHLTETELDVVCNSPLIYEANSVNGTLIEPYQLDFTLNTTTSYEITVAADPAEGGDVWGGGTYIEGSLCTLEAKANDGYYFVNWTKDGIAVSADESFSFVVTSDGHYVANFEEEIVNYYIVVVSANPAEGGQVTGTGSYSEGETASLTATANQGYHFISWTENGTVVSESPAYSFVVTENHDIVANFVVDGIEENTTASFVIYPNPANDKLYLDGRTMIQQIDIYNMSGSHVYSLAASSDKLEIDVDILQPGVYIIQVVSDGCIMKQRFVKM